MTHLKALVLINKLNEDERADFDTRFWGGIPMIDTLSYPVLGFIKEGVLLLNTKTGMTKYFSGSQIRVPEKICKTYDR